jgi:hypothetical protein
VTKHEIKVNVYAIVCECVERGVARGWARAHKHTDAPGAEYIQEQIETAVMGELCEYIEWGSHE